MPAATPVVVTAVFRPLPGRKDDLVDALRSRMPGVHEEAGCLLYAIHDADDGTITMIEKWASADELDAHGTGEPVSALSAAVDGLLAEPVHVVTMSPLPVGGAQGAL